MTPELKWPSTIFTKSSSHSFCATRVPWRGSAWSSTVTNLKVWPLTPPALFVSSRNSRMPFCQVVPKKACGPDSGPAEAMVISSAVAWVAAAAPMIRTRASVAVCKRVMGLSSRRTVCGCHSCSEKAARAGAQATTARRIRSDKASWGATPPPSFLPSTRLAQCGPMKLQRGIAVELVEGPPGPAALCYGRAVAEPVTKDNPPWPRRR